MARALLIMMTLGPALVSTSAGCLLSPPVEVEQPTNGAPYINPDDALPSEPVVVLVNDDEPVVLSMSRLYDPDPEERLYYAWYSARLGVATGTARRATTGDTPDAFGVYYSFVDLTDTLIQREIDPCQANLRDARQETVWLHVSDETFARATASGVEAQAGAFHVSHAWVLDLSQLTCQ